VKLHCPKSGISYTCNIGYGHGRVPHPIFNLPVKSLIKGQLEPFMAGRLTLEESHLFGCALINKLPVMWETYLPLELWQEDWGALVENLSVVALRYDDRRVADLPKFRITKATNDPAAIKGYMRALNSAITDLRESAFIETSVIKDRAEEAILRIVRNTLNKVASTRDKNKLPELMAAWAASVGKFPKTSVPIDADGTQMPLHEYWKSIIVKLFSSDSPVALLSDTVQQEDIAELLEHCEQTIEVGTLHSLLLLKKLRDAISVLEEFRPGKILVASGDTIAALLGNTQIKEYKEGEPQLSQYKNIAEFLAAKKVWRASNDL
jgi:hypothetical protein